MDLSRPPLSRHAPRKTGANIPFMAGRAGQDALHMMAGRLHEACGPARRTLALWLMGQTKGPVLWINAAWNRDRLHADGMVDWADPGRVIFVDAMRADDVLWSMEEALRAGAVALVIGDLPGLPGLTQVRRMHLAAETGGKSGPHTPLGVILTPDRGGAQGVESRWHLAPEHGASSGQWRLTRLRARTAPPADWILRRPDMNEPLRIKAA